MLDEIREILTEAVIRGALEVLRVRLGGTVAATYKDATELVTEADQRSDAAILEVFKHRFPLLDPEISFRLEESGDTGTPGLKLAGADPLDGTNHFACGGSLYSIQAHYMENGVPLVGMVFQPEAYLPLAETPDCVGRLAWAARGCGAWVLRSTFTGVSFSFAEPSRLRKRTIPSTRTFTACIPLSSKMTPEERGRATRALSSGLVASTTGTGGAGGNVMMTVLGGQQVYANFGAGTDLDLIPPQEIAEEAGLTVWDLRRRPPVWNVSKQPFVVAVTPEIAEAFLQAAGL